MRPVVRDPRAVVVVAATGVEAKALRRSLPAERVYESGIALARGKVPPCDLAISAGLAGALRTGLATGTVLVPRRIGTAGGAVRECDRAFVERALAAARARGFDVCDEPLLTAERLVHGAERARWARSGFAAVDMESALIDAPSVACVRIVLDTPEREISPAWEHAWRVFLTPAAWRDLPFLAREGPKCAARSAQVIAAALASGGF